MTSANITIRSVNALKAGETIWDAAHSHAVKGFGVRRQRGDPVYVIKYRVHGRQRFLTIGRHGAPWGPEQARREAKRLLGMVASGKDPQSEKSEARSRAADTLAGVVNSYLIYAKRKQKPRSYLETQRHLLTHWASLHSMSISEVSRRHVAAKLAQIQNERGPVSAARARAALSAMFNWAMREGVEIASNPVFGTNKPAEPKSRERVLSDDDLREIWTACGDDDYGKIIRLLILTAQRRDEVGAMDWGELDLEKQLWTIPGSRTKNRRDHHVPLTQLALDLLPLAPCASERKFVFGNGPRRNGDVHRGFSGWSKAKLQIDQRIQLNRARRGERLEPLQWRLHDLRRTCATGMADRLGVMPHIVEAVLNHASGHKAGVAGVYNRAKYETSVRSAMESWSSFLRKSVIQMRPY